MDGHSEMSIEELRLGLTQLSQEIEAISNDAFQKEADELRACYDFDKEPLNDREMKLVADTDDISAVVLKFGTEYQLYLGDDKAYNSFTGCVDSPELGPNDQIVLFGSYVDSLIANQPRTTRLCNSRERNGLPVIIGKELFDLVFPNYRIPGVHTDFVQIKQTNSVDCGIYSLLLANCLDPRNSY